MLNKVSQIFSPGGSGGFLRRMTDASLKVLRELDAQVIAQSPPSFPVEKLGDQIVVSVDDDCHVLYAHSVGLPEGEETRWYGKANPKANLFKLLTFVGDTDLERQKFIDYVYNYRNILVDLPKQTLTVLDSNMAEELVHPTKAQGKLAVMRAALG